MQARLVVPYPATNSTVRVRGLHWANRLQADVTVHGPGFSSGRVPGGEPVLLLRNARRASRGGAEARMLRSASVGVYDLDDGLPWDDGRLPGHRRAVARVFPRSMIARRSAKAADRVIAGNAVLAEWAAQHCRDVRIVPTCVEPADYRRRGSWEIGSHTPRIGWIGSPATERYLTDIAGAIREVHRRTGARLVVVSGPGPMPAELAPFTDKIEWSRESDRIIADWDVGIMPLRNGVYERAKCGYKLLQYAASGVPAVGSPVGVNAEMLTRMDGLAPTSTSEWVAAIGEILTESSRRRAARARAGFAVARSFSYDAWEPAFVEASEWKRG